MTGYESKKAAAQDKVVVTDLDGHVVRGARKPKKVAALDRDAEIQRLNEKIEFLARTNMLYSDWEHRDTQVTSELIRKGIEASKLNAELQAEIERLKAALAQPAQEPEVECDPKDLCAGCQCHLSHLTQEPDWKALVLEHNADCDSRCDMDACGYKGYFEFSNRRCPTCPVNEKIDVDYATQPAQEPVAYEYFKEWMVKEMPPMTTIGNPEWWAKRIYDRFIYTAQPAQEPVAYLCKPDQHGLFDIPTPDKACTDCFPVYAAPPQRQKVVFPTMLRKMWSGGEVQAWLDENVNKENT